MGMVFEVKFIFFDIFWKIFFFSKWKIIDWRQIKLETLGTSQTLMQSQKTCILKFTFLTFWKFGHGYTFLLKTAGYGYAFFLQYPESIWLETLGTSQTLMQKSFFLEI